MKPDDIDTKPIRKSMAQRRDEDAAMFRAPGPVVETEHRSPPFERPAVEHYLRADRDLPDGGCIDLGLEARESDDGTIWRALDLCVEKATEVMADAKEIAEKLGALLRDWFPDRYWFAEVWTPSGAVKRYQVIQPAVVGGFRR